MSPVLPCSHSIGSHPALRSFIGDLDFCLALAWCCCRSCTFKLHTVLLSSCLAARTLPPFEGYHLLQVLDWELQRQLVPYMKDMVPLPGIFDPDYIAANQDQRADQIIKGSKHEQMETVRGQIREFKQSTGVDKVSRVWV